jgi:hypothetical protein
MAPSGASRAHACGVAQSGRHAVTVTVAPARRSPTSGLSLSGCKCTRAGRVVTAAKNGALGAVVLICGGTSSLSAERGQPKSELRNEPHTARLRIDAGIIEDAVGLGCRRRPIGFFRLDDGCLRREHARCVPTFWTSRDAAHFACDSSESGEEPLPVAPAFNGDERFRRRLARMVALERRGKWRRFDWTARQVD